jgi:hypothetical protein
LRADDRFARHDVYPVREPEQRGVLGGDGRVEDVQANVADLADDRAARFERRVVGNVGRTLDLGFVDTRAHARQQLGDRRREEGRDDAGSQNATAPDRDCSPAKAPHRQPEFRVRKQAASR